MKKLNEKILSWCDNPENGAIDQAINVANHPCVIGNVCLMPDTHQGYGMPIGGVVALKNAISPNMVGVDIGCGMLAVKTSLSEINTDDLKSIMSKIRETIPVGFKHHKIPPAPDNEIFSSLAWETTKICQEQKHSAMLQIGTLGGGNHFIEIQKGNDGFIWFMIHSGSRNLGKQVADYYNKRAKNLCTQFHQLDVVKNDLAFLPTDSDDGLDYIHEMKLCLDFAYQNRKVMASFIKDAFTKTLGDIGFNVEINMHHNYASLENHYGQNVWVHRKGATLAREDTIGIIPGSQGAASYIVQGLGNEASLQSCSHGAGRKMSRKAARESLSVESESKLLDEKGVLHAIRGKDNLDEAPSAYKDIDEVMEQQKDLVKILVKLTPLGVIKG